MKKKTICIIMVLIVASISMEACTSYNFSGTIHAAKTTEEYQNLRLLEGIHTSNLELMKEAISSGATPENFSAANKIGMYTTLGNSYPTTALGNAIGAETILSKSIFCLAEAGEDINATNQHGQTYLSCSAKERETPYLIPALVLECGADPNILDDKNFSALDYYVGNPNARGDIIEDFVEHGAIVNAQTLRIALENDCGYIVMNSLAEVAREQGEVLGIGKIDEAALLGDMISLEEAFVSDNMEQYDTQIVLDSLWAFGTPKLIEEYQNNHEISYSETDGIHYLNIAAYFGNEDMLHYLIEEKHVNVNGEYSPKTQPTPLLHAITNKQYDAVKYLLSKGANINNFEFKDTNETVQAAANGDIEILKLLYTKGASKDEAQLFLTMGAAIQNNHIDTLGYLIGLNQGEINAKSKMNSYISPLVEAGKNNNIKIMKYLISLGADINGYEKDSAPLYWTSSSDKNNYEAVKLLIENGADPNIKLGSKESPLLEMIVGGNKGQLDLILNVGADVNSIIDGKNPVQNAAQRGSVNILKSLIQNGGNVDWQFEGETDEKSGYVRGDTPLHIAVRFGWRENVYELLRAGANAEIKNAQGETAYDVARKVQDNAIMALFEERMD